MAELTSKTKIGNLGLKFKIREWKGPWQKLCSSLCVSDKVVNSCSGKQQLLQWHVSSPHMWCGAQHALIDPKRSLGSTCHLPGGEASAPAHLTCSSTCQEHGSISNVAMPVAAGILVINTCIWFYHSFPKCCYHYKN